MKTNASVAASAGRGVNIALAHLEKVPKLNVVVQSKEEGKDHESIQSSTTPDSGVAKHKTASHTGKHRL